MSTVSQVVFLVVVLAGGGGAAHATIDPPSSSYSVLGFTRSGKHVVFQKRWSGGGQDCEETWLSIFEVKSRQRVKAPPVYRAGDCDNKPEISKKAGKRTRARLLKELGELAVKPTRLTRVKLNTLKGPGFTLTLEVKGRYPGLTNDIENDGKLRARLVLRLLYRVGDRSREVLQRRLTVSPSPHPEGYESYVWDKVTLTEGQLSPDGKALALIISNRPWVVPLAP